MQVSTTLLHPFCPSVALNTVSVKIQITLQDGHHLVNYKEIHLKLQAFVSSDNLGYTVQWNL